MKEQKLKSKSTKNSSVYQKGKVNCENHIRENGKRTRINSNKVMAVMIFVLFVVIYCVYLIIKLIQNPVSTFSVEQGRIYQEETATGYVIREETIVKGSNYKNGMVQIKSEGERVAKNEAIFRYYSSGEENLVKKIKDLDIKIDEVLANENELSNVDIKALEKQIEEKIETLYDQNDIQTISEIKKEINESITKKAKIAGEKSPAGSYLKKLINERSEYEKKLNSGTEHLKAPVSGVISYKVDGYEEVLTPKNFSSITKEVLENINIKTGQIIADSKESGKIINNFNSYIACISNSKQAKEATIGQKVKLKLANGEETDSNIEYISTEGEDVILIFQVDKGVKELISHRKISLDIIWWSYSGKKIPNASIGHESKGENEVAYVIRTRNGYQDKILVKILRANEKYAIVDNYTSSELTELGYGSDEIKNRKTLTLYDEILKDPSSDG